jgi:hypothetical protein
MGFPHNLRSLYVLIDCRVSKPLLDFTFAIRHEEMTRNYNEELFNSFLLQIHQMKETQN